MNSHVNVSVLLAVEGHDVLLVSSYEQDGTVDAVAQRFQPGHIERTGTVDIRDWKRTEVHTFCLELVSGINEQLNLVILNKLQSLNWFSFSFQRPQNMQKYDQLLMSRHPSVSHFELINVNDIYGIGQLL